MNLLRPSSSSSRQGKTGEGRTGQGRGAPAAATRSESVVVAPVAPDDGSSSAAGNPSRVTAAASPPLPSLQAAGLPTWWTNSSPMGSNEGYVFLSVLVFPTFILLLQVFMVENAFSI